MAGMEPESVDSIVCDPPYGLEFMGKAWDSLGRQGGGGFSKPGIGERERGWASFSSTSRYGNANPTCATCGGRARGEKRCECAVPEWKPIGKRRKSENEGLPDDVTSSGMASQLSAMQEWHTKWAQQAYRVVRTGGYLLAFSGTRTVHRLTCAMEDAGFVIEGTAQWIYGSGFPKSTNVAKAIDKSMGLLGTEAGGFTVAGRTDRNYPNPNVRGYVQPKLQSDEAKEWSGWGTALKPAWEPIVIGRKP